MRQTADAPLGCLAPNPCLLFQIKVVFDKHHDKSKVAIISGEPGAGGSLLVDVPQEGRGRVATGCLVMVLQGRLCRLDAAGKEGGTSGCNQSRGEGPRSVIRAGVGTEGPGGDVRVEVDVDAVRAAVGAQPFIARSLPSLFFPLMQHAFARTASASFTHCASSPPHATHAPLPRRRLWPRARPCRLRRQRYAVCCRVR